MLLKLHSVGAKCVAWEYRLRLKSCSSTIQYITHISQPSKYIFHFAWTSEAGSYHKWAKDKIRWPSDQSSYLGRGGRMLGMLWFSEKLPELCRKKCEPSHTNVIWYVFWSFLMSHGKEGVITFQSVLFLSKLQAGEICFGGVLAACPGLTSVPDINSTGSCRC